MEMLRTVRQSAFLPIELCCVVVLLTSVTVSHLKRNRTPAVCYLFPFHL